jgi:glyceraldehyde 3-phosphate dehydrogenase
MARVAINGLGRICRATLKLTMDEPELELVAVNDLSSPQELAYLLRYDSVYGRYSREVTSTQTAIVVDGREIPVSSEEDPARLPWRDREVDLVFECTGAFTNRNDMERHLQAGAKKRRSCRRRAKGTTCRWWCPA